jgi:hypothetical protein
MGSLCFHLPHRFGQPAATDLRLLESWGTDWSQLTFLPKERVWFLSCSDNGYEIAIAGDEQRPEPARLELARVVTARRTELMRQVIGYLDSNLDYSKFGSSGVWCLEGMEFGRESSQSPSTFEVVLTTDEYGGWEDCELWYVTRVLNATGFFELLGQRGGWYGYNLTHQIDRQPRTMMASPFDEKGRSRIR